MNEARIFFLMLYLLIASFSIKAQVITTIPAFPTQNDTITVIYDASEGNEELINTTPVYAHAGVITSNSSSDSDWQHVIGDWGTNDPDVLMSPLGNSKHEIEIDVQNFYGIEDGEEVYQLVFVFRNSNGTLVGREADGGDIYVPLYPEGNAANIVSPQNATLVSADEMIEISAQASDSANLFLYVDDIEVATEPNELGLSFDLNTSDYSEGQHWISFKAEFEDEAVWDSIYFTIMSETQIIPVPLDVKEGINTSYGTDDEVAFHLFAPGKESIYLIGDFNNWQFDNDYLLHQDLNGDHHWISISGLDPLEEYGFQYYIVDEGLRIGDPYCEKILDPWNDQYIDDETYPDLKEYPSDYTTQAVSVFKIDEEEFNWTDQSYIRPDQNSLIVYELLIRDFLDAHAYSVLLDTLNYLETLGVNAIELMPVNEFEGNESWGYNPSFFLAPDKFYGPKNAYKEFVDECHSRGIAIIMDIALNHSFGQNPQVRMYFDPNAGQWGQPTSESPWFNETPTHDYNVGYDYNHESEYTQKFVDSVLTHWVTEYHIDGYRMDLSKGFTQNVTIGDVGAWGEYDQSRIDILTDYADHIWDYDPDIYMILEHFANNNEETVLSNLGFMIWGNMNHEYTEAAMGYTSNLNWGSYQARGWDDPNLVSYMESHDEERMMFKNINFGASNGAYDIQDFNTAIKRCELSAVFFFPIPGPKMIWQFGELGYDYSINYCQDGTIDESCRTHPKPIEWGYTDVWQRSQLFTLYKELISLKRTYPVFETDTYSLNVGGYLKSIELMDDDMNVAVLGNFSTTEATMSFGFVHGGYWYEYFSGDSLLTGDFAQEEIDLAAGEYRLYTDVKISDGVSLSIDEEESTYNSITIFPNPAKDELNIDLSSFVKADKEIFIYSSIGTIIHYEKIPSGVELWNWKVNSTLTKGLYLIKVQSKDELRTAPFILE